jgi:hypothetical protein
MSDEPVNRYACPHPNDALDPRRYDGNHTVCHRCRTHVIVTIAHYASGLDTDTQYVDLVQRMNLESIKENEPVKLPNGVAGVCINCAQWQYWRVDGSIDCFNECRKRGLLCPSTS